MKRILIITLFLLTIISTSNYAQEIKNDSVLSPQKKRMEELDEYAKNTPKQNEENTKALAEYLIIPAKSDLEKARLIYTWVATHVKYDANAFNSGKLGDQSFASILKKRKAVCEGYSNLMKELCDNAGLQCEKVIGYSKGFGYEKGDKIKNTDHAWNVIKIGNEWKLFDATWGSGYGKKKDGKLVFTPRFDPYWFNTDPKEFIFSHVPEQQQWQLIEEPITVKQFEQLPKLDDSFFKLGFDLNQVYTEAMNGTTKNFAPTFSLLFPVKAIQLPYNEVISRSTSTDFVLQSDQAEEIVLIDGKTWVPFEKNGNTFTLSHQPKSKSVSICTKAKKQGKNYSTIIEYKAKK